MKRPRGMKKPLSNPTRFVTSLIPMQPKWRYPTPVVTPVNFYAPPQPTTLYHAPIAPALPVVPLSTLYGAPTAPEPEPLATLYAAPAPPAPEPDQSNIDMVEEKLNAMMQMDASYSFKYDNEFSSREETADPNGDVKGCSRHFFESRSLETMFYTIF